MLYISNAETRVFTWKDRSRYSRKRPKICPPQKALAVIECFMQNVLTVTIRFGFSGRQMFQPGGGDGPRAAAAAAQPARRRVSLGRASSLSRNSFERFVFFGETWSYDSCLFFSRFFVQFLSFADGILFLFER